MVLVSSSRGVIVRDVAILSGELNFDAIVERNCEHVRMEDALDARKVD